MFEAAGTERGWAPAPDGIDPSRPAAKGFPAGTGAIVILAVMIAAALAGVFGGSPEPAQVVRSSAAELRIETPRTLRSGMFFETRLHLVAFSRIDEATIAMSANLWRNITINSSMPQASEEAFEDGKFILRFGPLEAGQAITLKLDSQINPNLLLGNRGTIAVRNGDRTLLQTPVAMRVWP